MPQDTLRPMTRRRFLELAGAGALSVLAGLGLEGLPGRAAADSGDPALVSRVALHTFDPALTPVAEAVQGAALAVTDFSWLAPGDSVFVKLASNSNYAPPAVTSPAVLEGIVRLLQEAGAGTVYVGDMSGAMFVRHLPDETIGSTREVMRQNGLLAAAEAVGATVYCFDEVPYAQAYVMATPPGDHHWGADLHVAEILDRVDHIINLPRLGKHVLAGFSLGLKNAIGWVSDHSRMVLHRDAATFQEKLAEVNAIPQLADKMRLTLTLVDRALTTYGPDAGYALALESPLVIASEDVVSHDQIALLALLWGRERTPADMLSADPYPEQSNGFNWFFVRTTWGADAAAAYQDLPTHNDLAAPDALTHLNYAFEVLHGGRPESIDVLTGGLQPDPDLLALLTANPALGIRLAETTGT